MVVANREVYRGGAEREVAALGGGGLAVGAARLLAAGRPARSGRRRGRADAAVLEESAEGPVVTADLDRGAAEVNRTGVGVPPEARQRGPRHPQRAPHARRLATGLAGLALSSSMSSVSPAPARPRQAPLYSGRGLPEEGAGVRPARGGRPRPPGAATILYPRCVAFRSPRFMPKTYLIALDDSGQKGIHLPTNRSFGVGGIALPLIRLSDLRASWLRLMDLSPGQESKVPEFVEKFGALTPHRPPHVCARAFMSVFLKNLEALPIFAHVKKADAGQSLTVATRRGGRAVDSRQVYYTLLLQLAGFLMKRPSIRLRVISDQLSTAAEENECRNAWLSTLETFSSLGIPNIMDRIGPLTFGDSRHHPEIQVAGVLAGLLFQSSEAREELSAGMSDLLTEAASNSLSSFHLE